MKPVRRFDEDGSATLRSASLRWTVAIWVVLSLAPLRASGASPASLSLQTLLGFGSNPKNPDAGLVQATDGNFYGTTAFGGTNGENGTIFRIGSTGGLTTLFSFGDTNGNQPQGQLIQATDGRLYGTTEFGGTNGDNGTVFRLSLSGQFTLLYSFKGTNGSRPQGGLIQASDGQFYGTTAAGGVGSDSGTIFRINSNGVFTLLYTFPSNGRNGTSPLGSLFQHTDGNLYGTTSLGGASGDNGTVFRITLAGSFSSLASFNGGNGSGPAAGLVRGSDGNFYGTTQFGGATDNGTFFRVTPSGALTSLASFAGTNGNFPLAPLLASSDGFLYGTTSGDKSVGGTNTFGTVFRVTLAGALTTLAVFNATNGASPAAGLIRGTDGNYYGTTFEGGPAGGGSVFRLAEQPVLSWAPAGPGRLTLTRRSFSNGLYRVEFKPALNASAWSVLSPDLRAATNSISYTDNLTGVALRFYRVRLLP
jgi:uncharacterized repeat protein (TIGR03803 family)